MTATAHALVGGAIAAATHNPVLGITLSALSHPLLDMIPHWDFGWGWRKKTKLMLFGQAVFDLALGFGLAYLIFGQFIHNFWYFFACVFVSEAWDMAEVPYWFFGWKFFPFGFIYKLQSALNAKTKTMEMGIFTQLGTILVLIFILQLFQR